MLTESSHPSQCTENTVSLLNSSFSLVLTTADGEKVKIKITKLGKGSPSLQQRRLSFSSFLLGKSLNTKLKYLEKKIMQLLCSWWHISKSMLNVWMCRNLMEFNKKCTILHLGRTNPICREPTSWKAALNKKPWVPL